MVRVEDREQREKLFDGLKVYFSNSIRGEMGSVEDIGVEIVNFMAENGANVLSENVAFLEPEIGLPMFQRRTGIDLTKVTVAEERARIIREVDISWVDEATHLVAVVNGASYGVGMELQRAMDKPKMDMNETPVLCLVHKSCLESLSSMVRGVDTKKEGSNFELKVYEDVDGAKEIISDFLLRNR